jgi:glycosyltransferase involved in cell wall biosynthesis
MRFRMDENPALKKCASPAPLIAIVIPSFNAAATLGAAIESALGESEAEAEILVVDDGSTDGSRKIARGFAPRVRVLAEPHRGASAARNRGIAETASEWLLFLDADDLLLPGTLSQRLAAAAGCSDVVVCDWQEFSSDDGEEAEGAVRSIGPAVRAADVEIACAAHIWAPPAALLYRRRIVEEIGGFREDLPVIQDARFLFDAAYHGARFAHSPHLGARHRLSPHSLSRRNPARFWRDVLLNGAQIEALWRTQKPLSAARREALQGVYNHAARGLFAAADPRYFDAVRRLRSMGGRLPLHPKIAAPLAGLIGLRPARRLLRAVGR